MLRLPFNYILDESDPDIFRLCRRDGCFVAAFSARGATEEGIRGAAMDDYRILFEAHAISLALQPDEEQSKRLTSVDGIHRSAYELPPIGSAIECKTGTDARSFGESSKFPDAKESVRARAPTIHRRAHLATVCRIGVRASGGPSTWLPPRPHTRPNGFREARTGIGFRLRVREDRR